MNQAQYLAQSIIWPSIESSVQSVANAAVAANNSKMGISKPINGTKSPELFLASPARVITYQAIVHWNFAFKWGDHSQAGYWKAAVVVDDNFATTGTVTVGALKLKSKDQEEITPYSGDLRDNHGVKIATVVNGLITSVEF